MERLFLFCLMCISLIGFAQKSDFCVTYPSGKTLCYIITAPNMVAIGENSNSNNGWYSFEGSISIPESVTDRGDTYTIYNVRGFRNTNLTSVKLSEKVTVIDYYAFLNCKKLTNINLPNSLVNIFPCAFQNCSSLTSINIPNNVETISRRTFKNTGLVSVVIPATVKLVGRSAFESCHNLQTATIGCNRIAGTENIVKKKKESSYDNDVDYDYSFEKAKDYTSYRLNLVGGAFENCENLQKVILTNSVIHIGARTFRGCTNLREINIPNSVAYIGWRAFENCVSLRDVVIPEGVTTLGMDAFAGCRRLRTIKLPLSLVEITNSNEHELDLNGEYLEDHGVFYNCPSLERIIIPFASYEKYVELLPEYKDKFVEEEGRDNLDGEFQDKTYGQDYKSLYGRFIRDKCYEYILHDCDGWEYIYLDNDSIPELVLYGISRGAGSRILSVLEDTVIEEYIGFDLNYYIPKSGLLFSNYGNNGDFHADIICLNHVFSRVIELGEVIDFEKIFEIQEKTENYDEAYSQALEKKFTTYYKYDKEGSSEGTVITKEVYDRAIYSAYTSKGKSIQLGDHEQDINLLLGELGLVDLQVIYNLIH